MPYAVQGATKRSREAISQKSALANFLAVPMQAAYAVHTACSFFSDVDSCTNMLYRAQTRRGPRKLYRVYRLWKKPLQLTPT